MINNITELNEYIHKTINNNINTYNVANDKNKDYWKRFTECTKEIDCDNSDFWDYVEFKREH